MKTLKINLIPYKLRTKEGVIRLSPSFRSISMEAKELGVKLLKVDFPDEETFIIHSGFVDVPHILRSIIYAHADFFGCKNIIEASDFLALIEKDNSQSKEASGLRN